ncbi:MAG: hypothetical protein ABI625_28320, partial [bacterium]
DESFYIGAAKSMASGLGYRVAGRVQTQYPPGWSLFLMPVEWLTNGDYAWFARYTAALLPLVLYASWVLYAARKERHAWWLIAALIVSPTVFEIATREVRSEIVFTVMTIGFLAWVERTNSAPIRGWVSARALVGALLLLGAVATRTIGVALAVAVVMTGLHIAVTQRARLKQYTQRMLVPVTVSALYMVSWSRWTKGHIVLTYPGEPTAYDRWFWMRDPHHPTAGEATVFQVLQRIPGNIRIQAAEAASILTNMGWIEPSWTSPLVVVSAVVLVVGLIEEWRRSIPLVSWYVLGYMGVLAVWPFDEGTRYIMPLIPLIALLVVSGCRGMAKAFRARPRVTARTVAVIAAVELVALANGLRSSTGGIGKQAIVGLLFWAGCIAAAALAEIRMTPAGVPGSRRVVNYSRAAYLAGFGVLGVLGIARIARFNVTRQLQIPAGPIHQVSEWLSANAPDSSVTMARHFASLNFATHHKTVPYPLTLSEDVMRAAIRGQKPTFLVVVDSTGYEYYYPSEPARLALIEKALNAPLKQRARLKGAAIYEFQPATSTSTAP